jgi:NAD-dependent deacetylase
MRSPTAPEQITREILARATRTLVLTGAGISAESGVPTFRGAGGLWKSHRPETLATPEAFARDPRLVWEWYGWRRERVSACRPNAAHLALARAAAARDGVHIVTQNVDGLHAEAARDVGAGTRAMPLELHGSLFRTRCTRCGDEREHRERVDATSRVTLPACAACGGLLRPAVVWFGEALDPAVLERAWSLASSSDACLVIGTSGVVQPAASLAEVTRAAGGAVIEVNPDETSISARAAVVLRGRATQVVPDVLRRA